MTTRMTSPVTTAMPTPGHTAGGHTSDHRAGGPSRSDQTLVATLLTTARVTTKWALTGGLIAAAAFAAGWAERGHADASRLNRRDR